MTRFARWIVSKYPLAWRERYEVEVLDLLDRNPPSVVDVGELFRELLVEHVRAAIDIERPQQAATSILRLKAFAVAAGIAATYITGFALWFLFPLVGEELDTVAVWVVVMWSVVALPLLGHWLYQRRKPTVDRRPIPAWLAVLLLPFAVVSSGAYVWLRLSSGGWNDYFSALYQGAYMSGPLMAWLLMQIWPGQTLVKALTEFHMAENAVQGAHRFIGSCKEWIAKGVPSPLKDAEAALAQRIAERDAALSRLQAVGHRNRIPAV